LKATSGFGGMGRGGKTNKRDQKKAVALLSLP